MGLAAFAAAQYPPAGRFQSAIDAFLAAEASAPTPRGAIVAVGSSSVRFWHRRIAEDLAPLTIIPRGFGGSTMADARHYVAELVLRHEPRAILLYEGDNDVAIGATPAQILKQFDAFVAAIHDRLPTVRIYTLAVKPSVARWHLWETMAATNTLLASRAEDDPRLAFIDVATPMLNDEGRPRADLFVADNLHMNSTGYDLWRDVVRPVLASAEGRFEEAQ